MRVPTLIKIERVGRWGEVLDSRDGVNHRRLDACAYEGIGHEVHGDESGDALDQRGHTCWMRLGKSLKGLRWPWAEHVFASHE